MSGGPEDLIEREAVSKAKKRGWECFKVSWQGRRGAPDRLFMREGAAVWIEFKQPGEKPTEQQEKMHTKMYQAGLKVYWTDNVRQAMDILCIYER